MIILNKLPDFP